MLAYNAIEYKGKEKKAYNVGLGMVSVLCKKMIEDIMEDNSHETIQV